MNQCLAGWGGGEASFVEKFLLLNYLSMANDIEQPERGSQAATPQQVKPNGDLQLHSTEEMGISASTWNSKKLFL